MGTVQARRRITKRLAGRPARPGALARQRRIRADLLVRRNAARRALARTSRSLQAVLHLGRALTSLKHLGDLVTLQLVPEVARLLGAERATVYLADAARGELVSLVAMGMDFKELRFPLTRGIAGAAASGTAVVNVADAHRDSRFNPEFDRHSGFRTRSVLAAPMRDAAGTLVGVLQVLNKRRGGRFTAEDESLLSAIAAEASVAVVHARLVEAERQLFESCITTLAATLDARDPYTAGHTHRVTEYAVGIGKALGLARAELDRIRLAGILHDMGKIVVPDAVLTQAWGSDRTKFEIMKTHASYTRVIVRTLKRPPELDALPDEAAMHHERVDGSGYPGGLKGEAIPLIARVLAVADVFDAITSKRVYHDPMPIDRALAFIRQGAGTHFSPDLVDAFFRYFVMELQDRFR